MNTLLKSDDRLEFCTWIVISLFLLPSKMNAFLVHLLVLISVTIIGAQTVRNPQSFTSEAESYLAAGCYLIHFFAPFGRIEIFDENNFSA
jgi:hypothetical protein